MPRSRLIFSIILCGSLLACSGFPQGTQETVEQPPFDQAEGEIVALAERQSEADAAASSPPVGGQEELRPEPAAVESAPSPEPELVILPAGTVLEVRLAEPISSMTNKAGNELIAILDRDLKVDGKVVFPQGTKA